MKHRRLHNAVAVVLLALSCLAITGAVLTVWLHQVVLNTDRFVGVVTDVTADPAVAEELSQKLTVQIVDGVRVEERVTALLPDSLDRFAPPLTVGLSRRMETAMAAALSGETFRDAWPRLLSAAHGRLLAVLRGQSTSAQLSSSVLRVDLLSVTSVALTRLQADGALSDTIVVPTIEPFSSHDEGVGRIDAALGTSLSPEFGQVELTNATTLQKLSAIVRDFDLITIGFVLFSLGLGVVAIWFVDRRWRGVLVLLVSVAVAMAVLMLLLSVVSARAAEAIASPDSRVVIAAFVARLSGSLLGWLVVVLLATLLTAGSLYALRIGRGSSRETSEPPASPAI